MSATDIRSVSPVPRIGAASGETEGSPGAEISTHDSRPEILLTATAHDAIDGLDYPANRRFHYVHDRRGPPRIRRGSARLARRRPLPRHDDRSGHPRDRGPLFPRDHVAHEARGQGTESLGCLAGLLRADVSSVLPAPLAVPYRRRAVSFVSFVTAKGYVRRPRMRTVGTFNEISRYPAESSHNHGRQPWAGPGRRGLRCEAGIRSHH